MAETGGIAPAEMLKTFNCGVGMVLAVDASRAEAIAELLRGEGETVYMLGTVTGEAGMSYEGTLS